MTLIHELEAATREAVTLLIDKSDRGPVSLGKVVSQLEARNVPAGMLTRAQERKRIEEGSKEGGKGEDYEQFLQSGSDADTETTDWEDEEMTDVDMETIRKPVKQTVRGTVKKRRT